MATDTQVNEGLGSPNLHLVDSVAEAQNFLSWLGERRPHDAVAIDLETGEHKGRDKSGALSPWHGRIRLAQVGDGQTGWAIPWEMWSGVFYEGMNNYQGPVIAHNIAFESKWLAVNSDYKLPWDRAHDTMIMSQVFQPASPTHALKSLTDIYIDPRASALQGFLDQTMVKNGWTWGTIPVNFPIYWQYGALDTVITARLFTEHFYQHVKPGTQLNRAYELEMSNRRICTQMEINGARVDLEYSAQKFQQLMDYEEQAKTMAMQRYGYNIGSPSQLAQAVLSLGGEIVKQTKGGSPSMDKEAMDIYMRDGNKDVRELAELVNNVRKARKLAMSYFHNFQKDAVDGFLHPEIRTLEARTGRMSITNPALQTLPSGDPLVRHAFLPRNENERIVSSDLDQVEFRLTANFSKDQALINLFLEADRTGGDVFTEIMRQVYKDDSLQKSDPRRKLIKGTVYGKLYGAGVPKMALTSKVSESDMQEVVDAFDRTYPGVKQFQKRVEREGQERLDREGVGYVLTETGRRLPADDDKMYALTNYKIQGTAAELFKQNLIDLDAAGLTQYMLVPVHDEIVFSIPEEMIKDAAPVIQECMTTSKGWDVPLTAGCDYVNSKGEYFHTWGQKYEEDH
jgi:DNA polymerase-1